MFAMARKRDLPSFLEKVHTEHKVPHIGIFVSGGIIILLSIFGTLKVIVSTATFTILLYYSITNIAAMKMHRENKIYPNWIPVAGLLTRLSMAEFIEGETIIAGLSLLAFGLILRFIMQKTHTAKA